MKTEELNFEYAGSTFALDESGLTQAYLTFLRDEKNISYFTTWHTQTHPLFPAAFAWGIWMGFLVERDRMIFPSDQRIPLQGKEK